MIRVLVIGADGQLGFEIVKSLKDKNFKVFQTFHSDLDVTEKKKIDKFIQTIKPNYVINTAAFHNTRECETNPRKSFLVNSVGAYYVSKASSRVNAATIYISTDYVFDGIKKGYIETDTPNPINIYGASKLAGEELTRIGNKNYIIIRTSWLYGPKISKKGHNFVTMMLDKARNGERIEVVNDQFGSPTYTPDLAIAIKNLIAKHAPSGIYHISGSGYCTWYEFAKKIFQLSNLKTNLVSIKTKEDGLSRPKYSILIDNKLNKLKIDRLPKWEDSLATYLVK